MAQQTAPAASVTESRRTGRRVLASTLIGAHGFEHLISNSIPLLTTVIAVDLQLSALQVGAIVAVRSASAGITSVTGGFLSDLLHHRIAWVLSISTFLTAVGLLIIAMSPSYGVILLALAFASSGAALWHPPALGLLAQRFPTRRGLFLSLHRSMGSVGDVVGPLVAGILLLGALQWEATDGVVVGRNLGWEPVSWRWILACSAPIMFVATFIIYGLLRNAGDAPPVNFDVAGRLRTMWSGTSVAFRGTRLWAIFAVAAVRGMADGSMLFLVPLYLTQALGINTFQAAAHLALMVGPAIVTAPIIGAMSDRVGRKPLIVFLMAFATVLTLAMPLSGQQYSLWITVCVALYGLQHFTVINLTSAAAADVAAQYRLESSFLGLMWGNNVLFGAVAAVFIFGPIEWLGWQYGFFIAAGIYLVGFLASLMIPGKPRAPEAVAVPA
jgi:FSR family fosmidomycin resistance protein-like MFS transporter